MAGFIAKKLCPNLILLPLNFDKYTAKAQEVREILVEYDPRFESASIDEAYLNITEYCEEKDIKAEDAVEQMRREIHEKTKITVSAGIAANAKLAKICSNLNKPNGQYVLPRDRTAIMSFMRDMPTRKVNGVGRVFERELGAVGVKTCGDIYPQRQYLNQLFGEKAYEFLIRCYLGLGRTNIQPAEEYERKSVGTESTFREISDPERLREKLRWTADELEKDMQRAGCKGRTLCLKIKLHTYEVFTRQVVTPKAVCLADDLYNFSLPMLAKLEQEMPGMKLRLMGLRCTHLVSTKKPDTMAFFGFRPRRTDSADGADQSTGQGKRKVGDYLDDDDDGGDGWEKWPDEELQAYEAAIADEAALAVEQETGSPFRHHGKQIMPNPKKEATPEEEELWDCPICSRPQVPNERQFNEHIDLCLSRQTIRNAVQEDGQVVAPARSATPSEPKRTRTVERKKAPRNGADPRQKKLFFG
jgi:DNA polymerase kappa